MKKRNKAEREKIKTSNEPMEQSQLSITILIICAPYGP